MKKIVLLTILLLVASCAVLGQSFTPDQYGGDTAATCTPNGTPPNTFFRLYKAGNRWWFCTPDGHPMISMGVTMNINGANTWDCETNNVNKTGAPLNWTVSSGNIYVAPVTWVPAAVYQGGIGEGAGIGTKLTKETSLANVVAPGEWFFDSVANNLYVWTTTGASPGSFSVMNFPADTSQIFKAKYGTTGDTNGNTFNWAWQAEKRVQHWGFNSIAQDSSGYVSPVETCPSCNWPGGVNPIKMPDITEDKTSQYASVNLYNYLSSPIKDLLSMTSNKYTGPYFDPIFDAFDPNLNYEWQSELSQCQYVNGNPGCRMKYSQWLMGVFVDDSDLFYGMVTGPDFVNGEPNPNIGWVVLTSSPVQNFTASTWYQGHKFIYTPQTNFSKAQAITPSTCSTDSPCSMRDYLYVKYNGSIGSLNGAWGSSYSQFDSTGIQITSEQPTGWVGNGTQTQFTTTSLLHTPISPLSILISVGGVAKIGDCPWFDHAKRYGSGCTATAANTGVLESPTTNYIGASTINYATGAITVNFITAPANGTPITINYIYNGWMSGGNGLMDEYGASSWVGNNSWCLEGADPKFPTYFACTGQGGDYHPVPALSFPITGTAAGAPASITTSSGGTITNEQNVYVTGAASSGCNGGPFQVTVVNSTSYQINNPSCGTAGAGGWIESAVAVDVDNWISEFAAQWAKTIFTDFKGTAPCVLASPKICWTGSLVPIFGLDNIGSYAFSKVYQGFANADNPGHPYMDGYFDGILPWAKEQNLQPGEFQTAFQYDTFYMGDRPFLNFTLITANPDSAVSCFNTGQQVLTQGARSQPTGQIPGYYGAVNYGLTTLSANNTYQVIGFEWWSLQDLQYDNWGLVSQNDNAYDGIEAIRNPQACETSYYTVNSTATCGNEDANYGDAITNIVNANKIWPTLISGTQPCFSATPNPINFGSVNVGSSSTAQTDTITNGCSGSLILGAITSSNTQFVISSDGCSNQTLGANVSCTYQVTFTPSSAGAQNATITIPDNVGNPDFVSATGTGVVSSTVLLTVNFNGSGGGIVKSTDGAVNCGSSCSVTYNVGTQVTLSGSPDSISSFSGWTGPCTGTGNCIFTINANTTVTATFTQNTPRGRSKKLIF